MIITWKTLIALLGGQAMFLAGVGWIFKMVITKWLERDTERFKSKLQLATSVEVEQLKSSLEMVALEHQVRFTKLHERRAEVIADLYQRVVNLFWNSQQYVFRGGYIDDPKQQEEFNKASGEAWGLAHFIDAHRIYLPEAVCSSLDNFTNEIRKRVVSVGIHSRLDLTTQNARKQYGAELMKAVEAFEKDIPLLRRVLEVEFRKILDVDSIGNDCRKVKE